MPAGERRWLARAQPLGDGAPGWAQRMHQRSLLVLRALTDPHSGASLAGARPGWAYVWPRDAGTAAIAFAAAGYRPEARRLARFLLGLDLDAAARFRATGEPVPGRDAQGDTAGWVVAAARAAELPVPRLTRSWRDRADYHEKEPGDYVANALAATASGVPFPYMGRERHTGTGTGAVEGFVSPAGLVRVAGEPGSGWDSAAAWGVRPFTQPALFPEIRRTLRRIAADSGRFGILPSESWDGGEDPWTAPTAWTAWGLAGLAREAAAHGRRATADADRRAALRLMAALRRASTPSGLIPERVDRRTGVPASTTPLAWSHAFAILAIRELWP